MKREEVRFADSVSLLARRSGVFDSIFELDSMGCVGWCLLRKVDKDSVIADVGVFGSFASWAALASVGASSPRISSSSSGPYSKSSSSPWVSRSWSRSVSRLMSALWVKRFD